jgi:hypothetical protein
MDQKSYTVSEMYDYVQLVLQHGVEAVAQDYDIDENKLQTWMEKINYIERTRLVLPNSTRIISNEAYLQKLQAGRDLVRTLKALYSQGEHISSVTLVNMARQGYLDVFGDKPTKCILRWIKQCMKKAGIPTGGRQRRQTITKSKCDAEQCNGCQSNNGCTGL